MKIAVAIPTKMALTVFTLPRYSGARKRESAPKVLIKSPLIALAIMNQKNNKIWYFLRCRSSN
jgi:hypothetical protein